MHSKSKYPLFVLIPVLVLGVLLTWGNFTLAQEAFDLGKVVVTATRAARVLKNTPGSVTVIDEEKISSSKTKDAGELLEQVAGVQVNDYGSGGMSSISLRGTSSQQTLVMVDGRPLNLASSGNIDLSLVPLENVKKNRGGKRFFFCPVWPGSPGWCGEYNH